MLEQIGSRDRRVVTRLLAEDGPKVPLEDPGHARHAGECRLLRADIYALRVEAIRLQQPDELATPAANVHHGTGRRLRK
jgi:hypothetical protein